MKQKGPRVAAAIEIGSSAVRMRVAQWTRDELTIIDTLERPARIGQEVFTTGRLGFETVRDLSDILEGYAGIAREYGVDKPRVIATTALREAANREYLLDLLRVQNHMDVEVLEEGEGNFIIFNEMMRRMANLPSKLLLVHAGTGSTGVAAYEDGVAVFAHSLHTGTLKISEMLLEAAAKTRHIDRAAEEYVAAHLAAVGTLHEFAKRHTLVISGNEIDILCEICGAEREAKGAAVIESKSLYAQWEVIKETEPYKLSSRYDISAQKAERLYALFAIFTGLAKLSGAKKIHCPNVDMLESLLSLQLRPGARRVFEEFQRECAISSARRTAMRFGCGLNHSEHVSRTAGILFDHLRKIHGLSRRQRILLEAACIMYEAGAFANSRSVGGASLAMIRDMNLYGLCEYDTVLIAHIAGQPYSAPNGGATRLEESDSLFVAKMRALLRIAAALDYSRTQKAAVTNVEVMRNRIVIHVSTKEDFALEEWAFAQESALFEEVFGMATQLAVERMPL